MAPRSQRARATRLARGLVSGHTGVVPGLDDLTFDNWYLDDLPGDATPATSDAATAPRQVPGATWSYVNPTPTASPTLLTHSPEMADELGIDGDTVASQEFAEVFSGNATVRGMAPFAMNYGGHQFGNWAGQLGDGRAIALGEVDTPQGSHQVLQLKGAGPTPYSRAGDGRAVLRSSVREFLCSEAMHHLGVPTTRALSLTLTGDDVVRDMLYDGHPAPEPGAVVCRVAPSFVRFGHFELPASRGESDVLEALIDHTIRRHFPHLVTGTAIDHATIAAWFQEVSDRTIRLMVDWMRVGFVHGVMNTDNLSILGLTIDYGPYGWLEDYDPAWTPNTTDRERRRYRYGNQPNMGLWNLARLGSAIHTITNDPEPLQHTLDSYGDAFGAAWDEALNAKLGLSHVDTTRASELSAQLLELLPAAEIDMTIFFRRLGAVDLSPPEDGAAIDDRFDAAGADHELLAPLRASFYVPDQFDTELTAKFAGWLRRYIELSATVPVSSERRREDMHRVNPKYVLRNYLAQQAIDKAELGDAGMIDELLDVLRSPYDEQPGRDEYAALRPDWARTKVGCSMLSCSS